MLNSHEIAVLGGGLGYLEVVDLVEQINSEDRSHYTITSVLDDDPAVSERWRAEGYQSGALLDWKHLPERTKFVYAIGTFQSRMSRRSLLQQLGIPSSRFATLLHPTAQISSDSSIGAGSIIHSNVTLYPGSRIGAHVILSAGCVIGVNTSIDNYSLLAAGVTTATNVVIGECVMLGTSVTVGPNIRMAEGSMAAVGSVVLRDVDAFIQVIGNPAKPYMRMNPSSTSTGAAPEPNA
jgi:sugar O-acyltransferase (sialic acid O-acetyltransferase NeuD family)